jgi:stage V sporulation protein AB
MTHMIGNVSLIFIGLAGGLAVGSALVAFLVVLDLIPRLAQITRTGSRIHWYEGAVVSGALFWTITDFFHIHFWFSPIGTGVIGIFAGAFVGMLAAALTEVLNVLPILAKRLHMGNYIVWLLMAMVFGKVLGSLFDWLMNRI